MIDISNKRWASVGRVFIWSTVLLMNVDSWVLPFYYPEGHLRLMALMFPGYVNQLSILHQSPFTDDSHRLLGGVLLILGALQFEPNLRRSKPFIHRVSGYGYLTLGFIAAITGVILVLRHGFGGFPHTAIVLVVVLMYMGMLAKAFVHARAKNYQYHREWMIRGFALGLFVATVRNLIFVMVAAGGFGASPQEIFNTAFFMSVLLNLSVAEWWIQRTKPRSLHGAPSIQAVQS